MCEVLFQFSEKNGIKKDNISPSGSLHSIGEIYTKNKYFKWSELCTHSSTNMKKDNTFEKTVS